MSASPRTPSAISAGVSFRGLEKIFRRFYVKAAQIIVQSRQNERVCTRSCGDPASNEWFGLNVSEEPEIQRWAKKVMAVRLRSASSLVRNLQHYCQTWDTTVCTNERFLTATPPLVIEISLHTSEGDRLVLEQWVFAFKEMSREQREATGHVEDTAVYNRLTILLKSVLSVSRALPAYKYARNQNCDSYVFLYQVYAQEPNSASLGESFQTCPVSAALP